MRCMDNMSRKLHHVISFWFVKWGNFVYRYPKLVIGVSILMFLGLFYGFTLHEVETDNTKLWIPEDSQGIKDEQKIQDVFTTRRD